MQYVVRNTARRAVAVFASIFVFAGATQARPAGEEGPDCGPAIDVGEVRVVDTQSEDAAASMPGFGSEYEVFSAVWPFPSQGSRVQTVREAKRWAARHGCHLLYVGIEMDADDTWTSVGSSDARNNAPVTGRRYVQLRVGVLSDGE